MKEFVKTNKVTYNLMSFTGFKALLIFNMLTEGPKSYEEISSAIEHNEYLKEKISIDTMRVYINSLKRIGCEVKRKRDENKISKYYITSHPFELKITNEQLNSLIKIYKNLAKSMNIKEIIYMDNLFEKIGKHIKNDNIVNEIRKYSIIRDIDKDLLKNLMNCCDNKNIITVIYKSPNSGEKDIEIITNNIDISNGKVYLYGYGTEYNQTTGFLVNRIKAIKEIKGVATEQQPLKTKVIYKVNSPKNKFIPADFEIIEQEENGSYTVLAQTDNPFYLMQRLLELGPNCKIISPESFKNKFIKTLKDMKAGYQND